MSSRLRTLTRRNLILMGCVLALGLVLALRPDTVTSIEGQLTRKLDEAAERRRLAEIERRFSRR